MLINSIPTETVSQHSSAKHTGEIKISASAVETVWFLVCFVLTSLGTDLDGQPLLLVLLVLKIQLINQKVSSLKANTQSFFMRFLFLFPKPHNSRCVHNVSRSNIQL